MYSASFDWGNIDQFTFNRHQLDDMKKTCQKHCFSTLTTILPIVTTTRAIKWMWENVQRRFFKIGQTSSGAEPDRLVRRDGFIWIGLHVA
jgi:hypothetical protein